MKNITKIICGVIMGATIAFTCVACTNDENENVEETTIATESTEVEATKDTTEDVTEDTTEETTEEIAEETTEDVTNDTEATTVETETDVTEINITETTVVATTIAKKQAAKQNGTTHSQTTNFNKEDRDMGSSSFEEEVEALEVEDYEPVNSSVADADADYVLLCNAVAHEAGSNWISTSEKAKVAEVILNRVNSGSYPDSVYGVITQKGQFSGCWNYANLDGYSNKVTDDVKTAVDMALSSDYNNHGYTGFWGDGSQNHFH